MSVADYLTSTYQRLVDLLTASADFYGTDAGKVRPGNLLLYLPGKATPRNKPSAQDGDYPQASLSLRDGSYVLNTAEETYGSEAGTFGNCSSPTATLTGTYLLSITSRLLSIGEADGLVIAALDAFRRAGKRLTLNGVDADHVYGVGRIVWTTKDTARDEARGTYRLVSQLVIPVTMILLGTEGL